MTLCQCSAYARTTERAALAAARWLGRADQAAAEEAACGGMKAALETLPIEGRIVIGATEDSKLLAPGEIVGAGGERVDLALDPLEGRGVVARGGSGAMSMIAVGDPGALSELPNMYMRKMAVGPRARGKIDLGRPVGETIQAIAEAFGRRVNDVTTIVLDRPRHHDLIEEIRESGARIKLIQDGDVTASISCAIRGTNDHLAVGIGGTRQALPRRRSAGAALADDARRDRGGARGGHRRRHPPVRDRRSHARRVDRRGDRGLQWRSAARRPVPHRLGAYEHARDVHAL
jgi:fructose-1,6-bisphosphatase II